MNILVVNYRDRMHPAAGGAEKHLHCIFSQLVKAGHKVVLFTTAFPGCKSRENIDGIEVVRKGGDLFFQLTVAANIKKLDREFNFDVVVEDLNKLPLFTPFWIKKPVVVQMHHLWRASIFHEVAFPIAFMVWAFERVIPWFYRKQPFVVVSPSTKHELAEIGIAEDRISVIYNGADDKATEPTATSEDTSTKNAPAEAEGMPYFLWLSRIHRYKGIWTALQAFEEFAQKHPDIKLLVAGDGPLLKKIPAWLKQRGLENRVKLLGFVHSEKKEQLLRHAIALLQTSFKEGWGLTVVEAAKFGITTIASDVPGLRDSVKNGETGLLFPVADAHTCAAEMDRLYSDDELRSRLASEARIYADEFRWDTAAELTFNLLQDTVIRHHVAEGEPDE